MALSVDEQVEQLFRQKTIEQIREVPRGSYSMILQRDLELSLSITL